GSRVAAAAPLQWRGRDTARGSVGGVDDCGSETLPAEAIRLGRPTKGHAVLKAASSFSPHGLAGSLLVFSRSYISASSSGAVIIVAPPKIDGWNPIAASVGIARTHHVDAVPATLGLDCDPISVFVSRTLARTNVSMKESADSSRDVSKGRSECLACA